MDHNKAFQTSSTLHLAGIAIRLNVSNSRISKITNHPMETQIKDSLTALLAAIKSLPRGSPIPVVLCSTLDERKRGMEMGAAAYLVKPVLPTTLLKTLRQVIRRN